MVHKLLKKLTNKENNKILKKILAVFASVALIVNLALFSMGLIDSSYFFTVIMFVGLLAFVFYKADFKGAK